MKKQPTERQIWKTWENEYKLSLKSGFSLTEAVQHADAALAAKRAQIEELQAKAAEALIAAQENSDEPAPVKRSPNGYNLYWCASANRYVSVPED